MMELAKQSKRYESNMLPNNSIKYARPTGRPDAQKPLQGFASAELCR